MKNFELKMSASPTYYHLIEKCTKLRTEVPLPSSCLNPKYLFIFVLSVVFFATIYFNSKGDLDPEVYNQIDLNYDLKEDDPAKVKVNRSNLLIFTRYRSGSSLIGELFNRHPDVFYIFEPFKLFPQGSDWNLFIRREASKFLSDMSECNFQKILNKSLSLQNTNNSNVKMWVRKSFCHKAKLTTDPEDDLNCFKAPVTAMERLCKQFPWVVSKTIRIYDINALVPYLQRDNKVVSLLRDPRGMISSRIKINQIKSNLSDEKYFRDMGLRTKEAAEHARIACNDIKSNLMSVKKLVKSLPEFNKLHYIIRYEDFAENPVEKAKLLYRFAGLNYHQVVHQWLLKATSGGKSQQYKPGSLNYSYSTERESSIKTAYSWRFHLPFKIVKTIQKVCHKELLTLGYISVNSIVELTDSDFKLHKKFTLPWLGQL